MTTEPVDLDALAAPLRVVVDAIEAGEMGAGVIARAYLAGALAALEAARTGDPVAMPTDTYGQ